MGLFLVFWLAGGRFAYKWERMAQHPLTPWSLGLLTIVGVGVLYSSADIATALSKWAKYHKLIYIPLIVSVLDSERWQQRARYAFLLASMVTLAGSYGQFAGLIEYGPIGEEYTPFKGRITQNVLMAFAAYLLFDEWAHRPRFRWLIGIGLALMVYNILFMVSGRTGQLVLVVLSGFAVFEHCRWRRLLVPSGLAVLLIVAAAYQLSAGFQQRALETVVDIHGFMAGELTELQINGSPTALRLAYYIESLQIFAQHPFLGTGTGSFHIVYEALAQHDGAPLTDNPHNEFLNLGVEVGLPGLFLFLMLLMRQWQVASSLVAEYASPGRALVLAMVIGCLFNSFLMDHGPGKFYTILSPVLFAGAKGRRSGGIGI